MLDIRLLSISFGYKNINNHMVWGQDIARDVVRLHTEIGHLGDMANVFGRDIVVVQSDETKPSQYTLNQFDAHGQITPCEGTLQQIREQNPDAVFIYYNGVNHFQALVPQEVGQQVQN